MSTPTNTIEIDYRTTSKRDPLQNLGSSYSIGTSFAIDTVERLYKDGTLAKSDLVINIGTLLRNHIDPKSKQKFSDVVELLKEELRFLFDEVVSVMAQYAKHPNPRLVLYLIDYDHCIPVIAKRPETDHRLFLKELIKWTILHLSSIFPKRDAVVQGVQIDIVVAPKGKLPFVFLYDLSRGGGLQDMVMISHCPLDFHIHRHVRKFAIIETHTGKYKSSKELGEKVFKIEGLPFFPVLHVLLGDKDYIAQTASIKDKRTVLDMAQRNKWAMASAATITADIRKANIPIACNLE